LAVVFLNTARRARHAAIDAIHDIRLECNFPAEDRNSY